MALVIPNNVASLVRDKVHRFATCWTITRTDSVTFRFTTGDTPISFGGSTFVPTGGFDSSARQARDALRGADIEFKGVISSAAITTDDLRFGFFRGATITEQLVDWRYPWAGAFITNSYLLGEVRFSGEHWEAQITGLSSLLDNQVGEIYSRNCRYDLGDSRCQFDLDSLKISSVDVDSSSDRLHFVATDAGFTGLAEDYFKFGEVTWLTGDNAGLVSEINASTEPVSDSITFELQTRTIKDISAGDTFDVVPGCEKTFAVCISKFANGINFGGFPHMPGGDRVRELPEKI